MKINDDGGSQIDFEPVFKRLSEGLSQINESLELICAGGYVMQLHGFRGTIDVDAFYKSNAEIDGVIRKVGDEFNINQLDELWLNKSISNMNQEPPAEHCEIVYKFDNLIVKSVDMLYLMGMKLTSAREKDLKDIAAILKEDKNRELLETLSKLQNIGFADIDISVILEAFGRAHGNAWLEDFYQEHESELQRYF